MDASRVTIPPTAIWFPLCLQICRDALAFFAIRGPVSSTDALPYRLWCHLATRRRVPIGTTSSNSFNRPARP